MITLGEIELGRGDLASAARRGTEALAAATRSQRESTIVIAHGLAAQIAEADGRPDDVRSHTDALRAIAPEPLSARARQVIAALR